MRYLRQHKALIPCQPDSGDTKRPLCTLPFSASPALAQESGGKCQAEPGPETTSVRTSQQIKVTMLLPQPSVPVESLRKGAVGQRACRQVLAVLTLLCSKKTCLRLSRQSQSNSLHKAAALVTRGKAECAGYFDTLWKDAISHHKPHLCIFHTRTNCVGSALWNEMSAHHPREN